MLTFVKFGGSVITQKRGPEAANLPIIRRLATEIAAARTAHPELKLLMGHGSGSFGHVSAARYGIHRGLADDADWIGFALTSGAALRLNRMVGDALLAAGVPVLSVQPSATLRSAAGEITDWQTETIALALQRRLVPLLHGDVAFDSVQGSAILSTEALFSYLALHTALRPVRIVLVGEDGVYTADPHIDLNAQRISVITAASIAQVLTGTGAAHAVDVTGGMRTKIEMMWRLVEAIPELEIYLIGTAAGLLTRALLGEAQGEGTRLCLR